MYGGLFCQPPSPACLILHPSQGKSVHYCSDQGICCVCMCLGISLMHQTESRDPVDMLLMAVLALLLVVPFSLTAAVAAAALFILICTQRACCVFLSSRSSSEALLAETRTALTLLRSTINFSRPLPSFQTCLAQRTCNRRIKITLWAKLLLLSTPIADRQHAKTFHYKTVLTCPRD